MIATRSINYTYPPQETHSIESALFRVWQGDYTKWQAIRRQVVDDDLGRTPEARLALLLGEEAVRYQLPSENRKALDKYLFHIGCRAIEANSFSVIDGIAPLIRYFFIDATDGFAFNYGCVLLDLLLPKIQSAMEASSIDLSLGTGLSGILMSIGNGLDNQFTDKRIKNYVNDFRKLLLDYSYRLQLWQLPINSTDEQYTMLPDRIAKLEAIWETPERTCWASGDVGQAVFLLRASRWLDQPELATWAIRIATYTIFCRIIGRLTVEPSGIRWGKAGIMLLYHQLHKLTDEPLFEREMVYWQTQLTNRMLDLESAPLPDRSLFDGLPGIYAALRLINQGDLSLHSLLLD
jgi:hypothetical protein